MKTFDLSRSRAFKRSDAYEAFTKALAKSSQTLNKLDDGIYCIDDKPAPGSEVYNSMRSIRNAVRNEIGNQAVIVFKWELEYGSKEKGQWWGYLVSNTNYFLTKQYKKGHVFTPKQLQKSNFGNYHKWLNAGARGVSINTLASKVKRHCSLIG